MNAQAPAVRTTHTAVLVSIIVAAIAVTACALVAIAYMMGWLGPDGGVAKSSPPTPVSMSSPTQQVSGTASGVVLLPGETLVAPETSNAAAPTPGPTTPQYARAPVADPVPAAPKTSAAPAPPPSRAPRANAAPRPVTPSYARAAPAVMPQAEAPPALASPSSQEAPPLDNHCVNCGTVVSTSVSGDQWEVRVRFEDNTTRLLLYPTPPTFRNGQKVRLEDGRLVRVR